jgi:hypothetical protein
MSPEGSGCSFGTASLAFLSPASAAAVETCPEGHVLVMDCRGEGRAASAGHILLTRMQVRGAAGFVSDGTLRDTPAIAGLSMSVYAAGASPMTNLALHHAVDLQVPIGCAGVAVYPGRGHAAGVPQHRRRQHHSNPLRTGEGPMQITSIETVVPDLALYSATASRQRNTLNTRQR